MNKPHILVVGGGLAGLAAALELEDAGANVSLFEKSNTLGGRVKTDLKEGFLLDRGFQVLLTSYPAVKKYLSSLKLGNFQSGVHSFCRNKWMVFNNPLRHPSAFFKSHSFLKLLPLILYPVKKETTAQFIERCKIDPVLVDGFLYPFFRGVFLEKDLLADASIFKNYLLLFALGRATLPQGGMKELSACMAKMLKSGPKLNCKVMEASEKSITLENGSKIKGDGVILALDALSMKNLISFPEVKSCYTQTFYYRLKENEIPSGPFLYVKEKSNLTTICFPNKIASSYAPKGFDLLSVSSLGENDVKEEVCDLFKVSSEKLTLLAKVCIDHALPMQNHLSSNEIQKNGIFLAGETVGKASINGAIISGKEAAKACLTML